MAKRYLVMPFARSVNAHNAGTAWLGHFSKISILWNPHRPQCRCSSRYKCPITFQSVYTDYSNITSSRARIFDGNHKHQTRNHNRSTPKSNAVENSQSQQVGRLNIPLSAFFPNVVVWSALIITPSIRNAITYVRHYCDPFEKAPSRILFTNDLHRELTAPLWSLQ